MIDDWMADLKDRYKRALPDRVGELRRLVDALELAPGNREAVEAASGAFHRLHGSAGSYGFHEISALAGACEMEIDRSFSMDAPRSETLNRIRASLDKIAEAATSAAPAGDRSNDEETE